MITTTKNTATIPKEIQQDPHVSYAAMSKEGIKAIEQMSGKRWTNYNPSDPGVTILQMLAYSLLDLGYKSSFPMEDLLSDPSGKLDMKDKMWGAEEVLFSNPVLTSDFRKLLIDRVEWMKNCWVNPVKVNGAFSGMYQVHFELTDPLKLKWLKFQKGKDSEDKTKGFVDSIAKVVAAIQALLAQHRNLGTVFLKPGLLQPVVFSLTGTFRLKAGSNPEKIVAWIYYALNNYLSRFIHFKSYQQMKEMGMEVGEIMTGPRLENGFILDEDLLPLRREFDLDIARTTLIQNQSLEGIMELNVTSDGLDTANNSSIIPIKKGCSPFFDYSTASLRVASQEGLIFYLADQQVKKLDQAKIDSYYLTFTNRNPVSDADFKSKLGPEKPTGKYRKLKAYHSVQNVFPEYYGLKTNSSFEGVSRIKSSQIKQLKAYLMLFEQVVTDHHAQMAGMGDLLSFKSGVETGKALCQTYFSQGLYETPGARFIFKAFDTYRDDNEYLSEYPAQNWERFKANKNNAYISYLQEVKASDPDNIKRKASFLDHQLARLGESYKPDDLIQINPSYGNYGIARIETVSELLKYFPVYSENKGRSYFSANEREEENGPHHRLYSGLEYKLGITHQLSAYYLGIVDIVTNGLKTRDPYLHIGHSAGQGASRDQERYILVYYYGDLILKLQKTNEKDEVVIHQHLEVLKQLAFETKGFVMIDNQLIVSNLQNEPWKLFLDGKEIRLKNHKSTLTRLVNLLQEHAQKWKSKKARLAILDGKKLIYSDNPVFESKITLFLPAWVPKVNEERFKKLLNQRLVEEAPLNLGFEMYFMRMTGMARLMALRKDWLRGVYRLQRGRFMGEESRKAVWTILKLLVSLKQNVG